MYNSIRLMATVTTSVTLLIEDKKFLVDHYISLSKLIRDKISELKNNENGSTVKSTPFSNKQPEQRRFVT